MFKLTPETRKWWILLATSSSLALVFIDQTALSVALPAIQHELNLSSSLIQWVINAYLLTLSAIILLGGKLGDRLGHKSAFLFGIIVFTGSSILCALSKTGHWLIASRAIQGLGGAFMMPSTNALVVNAFPDQERGKALGIYVALAAVFLAIGPLLGGSLTQIFSWRAVFWINLPVALISILLSILSVPNWERTEKLNIDWLGFLISTLFISGCVLSFMEAPNLGWTSLPIAGLFLTSLLSFFLFIYWERKTQHPLIELNLFKNRTFSSLFIILLIIQSVGISIVFWSIFLQNILLFSPLQTGVILLPAMLPIVFMAPIGGYLRDKYGPTLPMSCGCSLLIISLIWISCLSHTLNYKYLLLGFFGFGIGMPLMLSGIMVTVMNMVDTQQRGIASAVLNCARQLGNSLGLAVLAGLLGSLNKWQLTIFLKQSPPPLGLIKENQIDGLLVHSAKAIEAIKGLPLHSINSLKIAAAKTYTTAFSITMAFSALFAFICLVLILKNIPKKTKLPTHAE